MNDPILIVGLGGTGALTVRAIKSFFKLRKEHENIEYLVIDLENTQILQDDNTGRFAKLETEKREICIVKPETIAERHHNLDKKSSKHKAQFQHILDWYPDPDQKFGYTQAKKGAAQYRFLGRLGFFLNEDKIVNAIQQKLDDVRDTRHRKGGSGDIANLTVCIIGSLAGGTGSGMFWDVVYRIRDMQKDAIINGFFLLPDVFAGSDFGGRIKTNTYGALKELSNLKNQREEFHAHYESDHEVHFPRGGMHSFDRVYLFNNELGDAWIIKEITDTCYYMGVNIASLFQPELRRKTSSVEANMKGDSAFPREERESTFVFSTIGSIIFGWFDKKEVMKKAGQFLAAELKRKIQLSSTQETCEKELLARFGKVLGRREPSSELMLREWIHETAKSREAKSAERSFAFFKKTTFRNCSQWDMEQFHEFLKEFFFLTGFDVDFTGSPYKVEYVPSIEKIYEQRDKKEKSEYITIISELEKFFFIDTTFHQNVLSFPLYMYHRKPFFKKIMEYLENKKANQVSFQHGYGDIQTNINNIRHYLLKRDDSPFFHGSPDYIRMLINRLFEMLEHMGVNDLVQKRMISTGELEVANKILAEVKQIYEKIDIEESESMNFLNKAASDIETTSKDGGISLKYLSSKSVNYIDLGKLIVSKNEKQINDHVVKTLNHLAGAAFKYAKAGNFDEFSEHLTQVIKNEIKLDERKDLKSVFGTEQEFFKFLYSCQTNIFGHRGRLVNNISERLTVLGYTPKIIQQEFLTPEDIEILGKQIETILQTKAEVIPCSDDYIIVLYQELFNSAEQLTRIYDYYEEYKKAPNQALFHIDKRWAEWDEIVIFERLNKNLCGNDGCDFDLSSVPRDVIICPGCQEPILNRCGNHGCPEDRLSEKKFDHKTRHCPTCKKYLKTYWWKCSLHGDIPIDKEYCPHCIYQKRKGTLLGEVSRRPTQTISIACPNCKREERKKPFIISGELLYYYLHGVNGHEHRPFEQLSSKILVGKVRCPECNTTIIPSCPASEDPDLPHFLFQRRVTTKSFDEHFTCATHKNHEFFNCFHCNYPVRHLDGSGETICPRCSRVLEKCSYCSDDKGILIEKVIDPDEKGKRWCPSCYLHPYLVPEKDAPLYDDDKQWCTNIFGCTAGKNILTNVFGKRVERCTICKHPDVLPLERRALEFHLHKCPLCYEAFHDGSEWNPPEGEGQHGQCYLCGMNVDKLAELQKFDKEEFHTIKLIMQILIQENTVKQIAERLYCEFGKHRIDFSEVVKAIKSFTVEMKKAQKDIVSRKLDQALEIIGQDFLGIEAKSSENSTKTDDYSWEFDKKKTSYEETQAKRGNKGSISLLKRETDDSKGLNDEE